MPDKLKQMQDIFYARGGEVQRAAARQLDARALEHAEAEPDGGANGVHLLGRAGQRARAARRRNILNKSYTITAEVTIPEGGAEGMIVTEGGRFGGYGLFLSKGEFGIRPGQGGVPLQPARPQAHDLGRARAGRRASTPSSSTSSPMVRAWARAGRACSTWTARKWPGIPWNTRTPITFPEDETFDIGQRHAHRRRAAGVSLRRRRSSSPARSTS
ncbi:MAG: hypothetical protein MZV70_60855 [Desulfobacterales bacterium]|nr:hypothetical protein [Desulfobacterales bacterium]